jgi:phage terminase small subunit
MAGRRTGAHPPKRPVPTAPPGEPAGLSDQETAIFQRLVASVDADHFAASDVPLLVAYAQAIAQHDRAVQAIRREGDVIDGRASPWIVVQEKAQRAMVALSMRLRLSPQARREKARLPEPRTWYETRRQDDEG